MSFDYEAYDEFFKDLVSFAPQRNSDPETLSLEEIDQVEVRINRYIPMTIRAFLHHAGMEYFIWSMNYWIHDPEEAIEEVL